jgi:hypothetical protein
MASQQHHSGAGSFPLSRCQRALIAGLLVLALARAMMPAWLHAEPGDAMPPPAAGWDAAGPETLPTTTAELAPWGGDYLAEDGYRPVDLAPANRIIPFADLLFWKLTEGSAENWAQEISPQGLGSLSGTANLVDAPFGWDAGLRAGIDYVRTVDQVGLSLYYTHFSTRATNTAAGEVYSDFLGNFYAGNPDGSAFGPHYEHANVDWGVQFHTIDLEWNRKLEISPSFTLQPFVGLKGAIIRQKINSTWFDPIDTSTQDYQFDSATENLRQQFWGIGPSIGVTALIPLSLTPAESLHLYCSPSGAVMMGHWTFSDQFQTDGPTSTTIPVPSNIAINSEPIHGAATMLRLAMGLEWERVGPRVASRFRVGYEAQVWLNQMQFYSFNMGRLNNLMSLQGGIVELGYSF